MTTIRSTRSDGTTAAARASRREDPPNIAMLKKLGEVVRKAGDGLRDKEVSIDVLEDHRVKLPGRGTGVSVSFGWGDESDALGGFPQLYLDHKNKRFYVGNSYQTLGPLKLPADFRMADLFVNKKDPAPRTTSQKALAALNAAIDGQIEQLYGKPHVDMEWDLSKRTWRKPDGQKLHKIVADEDKDKFRHGTQSFMFDLKNKEFWLEMIPGYSGDCWGPFKLPAGFDMKDLERPARSTRSARSTTSDSDRYDGGSSRRYVGGSDSNAGYTGPTLRDVIGGSGSNAGYTGPTMRDVIGGSGSNAGYTGPTLRDVIGGSGSTAGSPRNAYWSNRGGGGSGS